MHESAATTVRCCHIGVTPQRSSSDLLLFPSSPAGREVEDVAQLERLVPKIERAQTLSPEARDTINRLIARQGIAGGRDDPSHQMRRKAAIERVTSAMQAKESIAAVSDVAAR